MKGISLHLKDNALEHNQYALLQTHTHTYLILNIADDDFIAKKTSQSAPLSNSEGTQTSKAFDKTVVHNLT